MIAHLYSYYTQKLVYMQKILSVCIVIVSMFLQEDLPDMGRPMKR